MRRHRPMRSFTACLLLAALVPLLSARAGSTELPEGVPPGAVLATVAGHVDGDTIEVDLDGDAVVVRLAGLDAPEPGECFGPEAVAYVAELAPAGATVYLERSGADRDGAGRLIRYVWQPREHGKAYLLNTKLARDGYAAVDARADAPKYIANLARAEAGAKEKDAGLWGACGGPHEDGPTPTEVAEPKCDRTAGSSTLRIEQGGVEVPYVPWVSWPPELVATEDCGAWAFFAAEPTGSPLAGTSGRLYAARFDPARGAWLPATALPGGSIQFGVSAAVDGAGVVHVVYSSRTDAEPTSYAVLLHTTSDGAGSWSPPLPVAPDGRAGHQLNPDLVVDGDGQLHVAWQDQRARRDDQRDPATWNASAMADVYVGDFVDGAWSDPVQVDPSLDDPEVASRPYLAVAGDRLVAVWSVYPGTTDLDLVSARALYWSQRPLDGGEWSDAKILLDQTPTDEIGGRLVDLATDPRGGAVALYGRSTHGGMDLFLRRFSATSHDWESEVVIGTDQVFAYPALAIDREGTVFVVYETGVASATVVAGFAIARGADAPGPEVVLTPDEVGQEGRAAVAVGAAGLPWVVYLHQPSLVRPADAATCLRNVRFPRET